MGVERMKCCGALTHVYADAGNRKHNPECPTQSMTCWGGSHIYPQGNPRCECGYKKNFRTYSVDRTAPVWYDGSMFRFLAKLGLAKKAYDWYKNRKRKS